MELLSLDLSSTPEPVPATPLSEMVPTSTNEHSTKSPHLVSYPANLKFFVSIGGQKEQEYTYQLTHDINFVTAHPCAPSQRVRVLKSPTSPALQKIDVTGTVLDGNHNSHSTFRTGMSQSACVRVLLGRMD